VPRVQLICWNEGEGEARAQTLRKAGFDVRFEPFDVFPDAFKRVKADPPDAIVIDLSRLPSAGRDVGLAIREPRSTRFVPIVFVDGEPAKVARTKQLLPDATYTTWTRIRGALRSAIARAPSDPVVPSSRLAGYSGTPLVRKLGIKPDMTVGLIGAPDGFEASVEALPDGATFTRSPRARCDLLLLFVRTRADYERRLDAAAKRSGGEVWVCWPKKASGLQTDLGETAVRATGLARGLVDYKIAAVDETWSGLRFTRRKA
jgi:hypothetical protein